ncbi:MAG: zinc-ribbon domain-containing protein [Gorillibacterium sp.]|nr:zinc-ribbon domain-containing protein [Gorillibacterium sp.]
MAEKKDKYCPKCNQKADEKDKYCVHCGTPLFNGCSNKGDLFKKKCSTINRDNAAYCSSCGAPTEYYLQGLVHGTKINYDREERR